MCITRKYIKNKNKKIKKNQVLPVSPKTFTELGKQILNEKLFCEYCKKHYPFDEFKINCNGCDKLYHCGIAGRCIGQKCSIEMTEGKTYRMGYCLNCVDLKLHINTDNTDQCLCKTCQNS